MMTDLVQRVLADPDNELAAIMRAFKASEDACWHIDRHVIGVSESQRPGSDLVSTACVAALALARQWLRQRGPLQESGVAISTPFVVIDDEWLAGAPAAPPPHVYVCLTKNKDSLAPLRHDEAIPRASSGNAIIDSLLTGQERLSRLDGTFEGEPGGWIVTLPE